ncbi:MAG: zinc-binding alcohol dehydrogenase family protein [Bacteroidota bacterium]
MKAIRLNKAFDFQLIDVSEPTELKADEVIAKVHRIGICGTDLHAFTGNQPFFSYPRILGHELGVEVVELGQEVKHLNIGDKCTLEPYRNLREDQAVRNGKPNCGEEIRVFGVHEDGGMQEYIKYKASNLHSSPLLDFDQLALVEPLGIGFHAVNRAQLKSKDLVLVIGAGPIGLGTMEAVKIKGCKFIAMDINPNRLEVCKDQLNPEACILANQEGTEEAIREAFDGDLPTVIFDATGNKGSMENSLKYAAHGGKIVFIGLFQGDFSFHDPYFHKKELSLLASRNAMASDFKEIIKHMEKGMLDVSYWITQEVDFEQMPQLFPQWIKSPKGMIKNILKLG